MGNQKEFSLTPMSYLKIFFRRKFFFFIPVFAGLVVGISSGMLLPKQYQSQVVLLVEEGKTDNPLFSNIAVSTTVPQRVATIRESILGWNSLVTLVKRLNLDKNVKSTRDFESLVLHIRNNIIIRMRGLNIIELSYLGEDAQETQKIVQNITDIFIERNVEMQNTETADAIIFIEEQLRVYKGKIKSAEIAQIQEQLDALLVDSTEKHPLVRQLRDEIGRRRDELEKENLEFTASDTIKLQSTEPIIEEIRRALSRVETDKIKGPEKIADVTEAKVKLIERLDNVMARDITVNNAIYNQLLQRLETAKITQRLQSSKEGTRYVILDPARLPTKPARPNKPLVALAGLLLGGIIGIGLVFLSEFFDKSFLDVADAKEYLGMPLLGAISKITTIESLAEDREHSRWIVGLTLLTGAVVVIISAAIAAFLQ